MRWYWHASWALSSCCEHSLHTGPRWASRELSSKRSAAAHAAGARLAGPCLAPLLVATFAGGAGGAAADERQLCCSTGSLKLLATVAFVCTLHKLFTQVCARSRLVFSLTDFVQKLLVGFLFTIWCSSSKEMHHQECVVYIMAPMCWQHFSVAPGIECLEGAPFNGYQSTRKACSSSYMGARHSTVGC